MEGNVYFPPEALKQEYLQPTDTHRICGCKGTASYCPLVVNGAINRDAAWYYPDPKPAAAKIKGYVAFWRGVNVQR